MNYFVGAYASSPNVAGWDAELEGRYFQALKSLDHVKGLEHPFLGSLHAQDDAWFLENIDPNWDFVFTCIPGVMAAIGRNSHYGIASNDKLGRQEAIDFLAQAQLAVAKLNAHLGRQAVTAIQIHSAPNSNKASSSVTALEKSLETIQSWDWQGAQIVIEHCDAYVEGQAAAKGFLTLDEEIQAIQNVNEKLSSDIGLVINWGRSVIETRRTEGALEHIKKAKASGLLAGLMFSGVSDKETSFGTWNDSHMPPAPTTELLGAEDSLLTEAQILACLAAAEAESLPIVGVKIGVRPAQASIAERIDYNRSALAMMNKYKL